MSEKKFKHYPDFIQGTNPVLVKIESDLKYSLPDHILPNGDADVMAGLNLTVAAACLVRHPLLQDGRYKFWSGLKVDFQEGLFQIPPSSPEDNTLIYVQRLAINKQTQEVVLLTGYSGYGGTTWGACRLKEDASGKYVPAEDNHTYRFARDGSNRPIRVEDDIPANVY